MDLARRRPDCGECRVARPVHRRPDGGHDQRARRPETRGKLAWLGPSVSAVSRRGNCASATVATCTPAGTGTSPDRTWRRLVKATRLLAFDAVAWARSQRRLVLVIGVLAASDEFSDRAVVLVSDVRLPVDESRYAVITSERRSALSSTRYVRFWPSLTIRALDGTRSPVRVSCRRS